MFGYTKKLVIIRIFKIYLFIKQWIYESFCAQSNFTFKENDQYALEAPYNGESRFENKLKMKSKSSKSNPKSSKEPNTAGDQEVSTDALLKRRSTNQL